MQSLTLQETPDFQMTGLAQVGFTIAPQGPTVCEGYPGACPDPDSGAAGLPVFSTRRIARRFNLTGFAHGFVCAGG